ncbi:AbiV family abortive infection protein [Thermodesulfobacteriota bacterium]
MNVHEFIKTIRTGDLSNEEIGKGMHKSFVNAGELVEDAELLFAHRPARALSLAILALEETAKTVLLTNAAAKARNKNISWSELEKDLKLRSHAHKQAVFFAYGKTILEKLEVEGENLFTEESLPGGMGPLLDWMKQLGFYVDVADGKFISPMEFGSDNTDWARWLIDVVKQRLDSFEKLHNTEEKSIKVAKKAGELVEIIASSKDDNSFQNKLKELIKEYEKKT